MNAIRKLRTLLVLGVLACIPSLVFAAPPTREEIAATAAWFDGLEWPDLTGKPYVEVMIGRLRPQGFRNLVEPTRKDLVDGPAVRGFLLAEDKTTYTVLVDGITTKDAIPDKYDWPFAVQHIPKAHQETPPEFEVTMRTIELPVAVEDALAAVRKPVVEDKKRIRVPPKVSKVVALFGLARWCARAGRADLAASLDKELLTFDNFAAHGASGAKMSFRAVVENEVAHVLMWQAMIDLGEKELEPGDQVTRPELLAEFSRIARDFPGSSHHAEAVRLAETLRQMVAEDEAHGPRDEQKIVAMSREDQVREWIFALRDQNYFLPYMSDMPTDVGLRELEQLGFDAVPALLKALDDQRITRSIVCARRKEYPKQVLTVGDCAVDILSQIAGRDFGFDRHALPVIRHERDASRRREIEAWWKGVQKMGEKAWLIHCVSTATNNFGDKAERLRSIDPDAAVAAISAGLRVMQADAFLRCLAEIKSEAATDMLRREMRRSGHLEYRVLAAQALFERGAKDAVPAMVEEFRKWEPIDHPARTIDPNDPQGLIEFLVRSGDLEALKALATRNAWLPDEIQTEIVEAVTAEHDVEPVAAEAEALREQIAVSALEFRAARICDTAARALARRWPQRYAFQPLVTRFERDVQIVRMQNTWRVAHGLEKLPEPKRLVPEMENHDPNVVAACRWNDGKAVANFRVVVGSPLTADSFLAGLDQLQRALPKNCTGVEVSAERLGDGRGFVVEVEWVRGWRPPARRLKRGQASIELEPPTNFSLKILETGKSLYETEDRIASMETAYHQDERFVRAIEESLKSDTGKSLGIYFVSHVEFE